LSTAASRKEASPLFAPIVARASDGLISPRAGFASIAYGATAARNFFPLAAPKEKWAAIPRGKSKKFRAAVLRFASGPSTAPAIARGLTIAIEAASGAGS